MHFTHETVIGSTREFGGRKGKLQFEAMILIHVSHPSMFSEQNLPVLGRYVKEDILT